jgi:hypothetical protein
MKFYRECLHSREKSRKNMRVGIITEKCVIGIRFHIMENLENSFGKTPGISRLNLACSWTCIVFVRFASSQGDSMNFFLVLTSTLIPILPKLSKQYPITCKRERRTCKYHLKKNSVIARECFASWKISVNENVGGCEACCWDGFLFRYTLIESSTPMFHGHITPRHKRKNENFESKK